MIISERMDCGEICVGGPFSPPEKPIIKYGGVPGIARLHELHVVHDDISPSKTGRI
jgi:serine/threonine protein kinase